MISPQSASIQDEAGSSMYRNLRSREWFNKNSSDLEWRRSKNGVTAWVLDTSALLVHLVGSHAFSLASALDISKFFCCFWRVSLNVFWSQETVGTWFLGWVHQNTDLGQWSNVSKQWLKQRMIELEIKSNTKKQKKNKNSIEEAIDEGLEKAPFLMEDLGD